MSDDVVGFLVGDGWRAMLSRSRGWVVRGDDPDQVGAIEAALALRDPDLLRLTEMVTDPMPWGVRALGEAARVLGAQVEFNPLYTIDHQGHLARQEASRKKKPRK